jgi:hypothetical protein
MSTTQLTLNFEAGITDAYSTCREFVSARVHQIGRSQKSIAADMDLSASHLARKLAQSPSDSMRFTLDDLETYIDETDDVMPVYYLVEKYLAHGGDEIEALERRIAQLKSNQLASAPVSLKRGMR